jgi:hypothetical protein
VANQQKHSNNQVAQMSEESGMHLKEILSIDPTLVTLFRAEMAKRHVDMLLYNVSYFEADNNYLILAAYKGKKKGLRGSDPVHPDYEVEISPTEKKIVRIYTAK